MPSRPPTSGTCGRTERVLQGNGLVVFAGQPPRTCAAPVRLPATPSARRFIREDAVAYPDDLLSEGEHVIIHKHSHWKMLLVPYLVLIVTVGVGIWLAIL